MGVLEGVFMSVDECVGYGSTYLGRNGAGVSEDVWACGRARGYVRRCVGMWRLVIIY